MRNALPSAAASELFAESDPKLRRQVFVAHYEEKARALFYEIYRQPDLGNKEARRIFSKWGNEPSKRLLEEFHNYELLQMYDMWGRPPKKAFARRIVKINKTLPRENRHGTRGSCSVEAIRKQLDRLLKSAAGKKWLSAIVENKTLPSGQESSG